MQTNRQIDRLGLQVFISWGAFPVRGMKIPPCNPKRFFIGIIIMNNKERKYYRSKQADQLAIKIKGTNNNKVLIRIFLLYLKASI